MPTATAALPAPNKTAVSGRTITFTWTLRSYTNDYGEPATDVIEVTIRHDRGRKRFTATAQRVTLGRSDTCITRSYELYGGITLETRPVGRYSEKQRDEFADKALDTFRNAAHTGHPDLSKMMADIQMR